MKAINYILGVIILGVMGACTSSVERIDERLHESDRSFIDSKSDYMFHEATSCYFVVEGANPLADDDLRRVAFAYANAAGLAKYSRDMAYSVTHDYDENFKLAPNWFEEEKRYNREAENYEAEAKELKEQLQNLIASGKSTSEEGGIWVYHKLSYKVYVYKYYAGPYVKESISLFSKNGEDEIFSEYQRFTDAQLAEILDMTGTKYTVKRSRDYKF